MARWIVGLLLALITVSASALDQPVALQMLDANRIGDLDASLSRIQKAFESGAIDEYALRNAYRPFYQLSDAQVKQLQDWVANSPDSYPAHLALGIYYRRVAGEARGTDYISRTPAENLEKMREYEKLAEVELRRSLDLTAKPYLSIFHLLAINNRPDAPSLLMRANRMLPSNALVRLRYSRGLLPRWGGSYPAFDRYIEFNVSAGVPQSVILALRAFKLDDQGLTMLERGERDNAVRYFEEALATGKKVGDRFVIEFLVNSQNEVCSGIQRSQNCP